MKSIAILVENSRAYGRALIEGIASYAQSNCSWMLRPVSIEDAQVENLRQYDGIIARIADDDLAERILEADRPTVDVFCQKPHLGMAGVDSDHRTIGTIAQKFFQSRGFTHFAYCGLPGAAFSDAREQAFCNKDTFVYQLRKPLRLNESQFYNERLDRIQDAWPLSRWLKRLPKPVAVFCCNDLRAIQLQRVAARLGLRVPEDVSILGVDNDTIACSFADVPISSIDPNAFAIGFAAARILSAMLAKKPKRKHHRVHRVVPGKITERTSTDFMPVDPLWFGTALIYIARNVNRAVTASDIFKIAKRSSTHVESVFKTKLGISVQAYINSVKLAEARRLLDETDLRIAEIASRCGYSTPAYFCRVFTRTLGINPRNYGRSLSERRSQSRRKDNTNVDVQPK